MHKYNHSYRRSFVAALVTTALLSTYLQGDKREIHDSLESGVSSKDTIDVITNGHHVAVTMVTVKSDTSTNLEGEYTYAKAIEEYKQFAENSVKRRTSSVSSSASGGGGSKDEEKSPTSGKKIEERLSFFDSLEKSTPTKVEPRVLRRERGATKVDLDKRRSMFELRDIDEPRRQELSKRCSMDISTNTSLRHKVASFENVSETASSARTRTSGAMPQRDAKFKEKLASFSLKEKGLGNSAPQKRAPERDQNFYQKLESFSRMENGGEGGISPSEKKGGQEWKSASIPRSSPDRKTPFWSSSTTPAPAPLKDRIASFENLSPIADSSRKSRELSVSMENLHRTSSSERPLSALHGSQSVSSLYPFRRAPSTPFMVVELEEEERAEEQPCVRTNVAAGDGVRVSSLPSQRRERTVNRDPSRRVTVYEEVKKVELRRDVSRAPIYAIFDQPRWQEVNKGGRLNDSCELIPISLCGTKPLWTNSLALSGLSKS